MQQKNIILEGDKFIIAFPYNPTTVDKMRTLLNRVFDKNRKVWVVEVNAKNVGILQSMSFTWSDEAKKVGDSVISNHQEAIEKSRATHSDFYVPYLHERLFPFQRGGVEYIEHNKGRVLIGDEPGLGKSAQSLAWLQLHPELLPVLIISPSTVKYNWKDEVYKWVLNTNPICIDSQSGYKVGKDNDIVIINYDILIKYYDSIMREGFKVLILDECHYVKNKSAQRSQCVKALAESIPHVIGLSGTPFLNRPIEIFNILNIIKPSLFPDEGKFKWRYCNPKKTYFGWKFEGASNTAELSEILRANVMIRREKKDVLLELPDKTRTVVNLDIDMSEYLYASDRLVDWLVLNKNVTYEEASEKVAKAEGFLKLEYLKYIAVKHKIKQCVSWVKDFLDNGQKLVLFAHHKEFIDTLLEEFKEYEPLTIIGSDSAEQRNINIKLFQSDPSRQLIICGIKAANMGITLTAASTVAFLELDFVPAVHLQGEDRVHRIGQKNCANIYYFIAKNTIEEDIYSLLEEKYVIFQQVMSDNHTGSFKEGIEMESIEAQLLRRLNKKPTCESKGKTK